MGFGHAQLLRDIESRKEIIGLMPGQAGTQAIKTKVVAWNK